MTVSDECLAKVKEFEGLRLTAYQCSAGVWTIGYGHTAGVRKGQTITEAEAEQLLKDDLAECECFIDGLHLDLTQGQFDALVDFCFNLGTGALGASTLLKKIREGALTVEIQIQFRRWCYAGGQKLEGLVKRREWEAQRWAEK